MAFGTGTSSINGDAGIVRGIQKEVACECWCTAWGEIIPLMVKLIDEDGEMQVIRDIMVHSQKKKRYAGIPSTEYDCTLTVNGRNIRTWLIFYQTEGRWVLNFRQKNLKFLTLIIVVMAGPFINYLKCTGFPKRTLCICYFGNLFVIMSNYFVI